MRIIGVDCATADAKIGLALGHFDSAGLVVDEAALCAQKRSALSVIANWLPNGCEPTLLAIDAPLGWPRPLALELDSHQAGLPFAAPANSVFRRATDLFIRRELGKTPLDVGADRIARTAYAALKLLGDLRQELQQAIPLAWCPTDITTISAIEVYPAATLVAHRIISSGYKKPSEKERRLEILRSLSRHWTANIPAEALAESADVLDAAVCVLAGSDFIQGTAMHPEDQSLAEREGWIWARQREVQ